MFECFQRLLYFGFQAPGIGEVQAIHSSSQNWDSDSVLMQFAYAVLLVGAPGLPSVMGGSCGMPPSIEPPPRCRRSDDPPSFVCLAMLRNPFGF